MPPCTNNYFKRNAANVITCETRFRYRGDRSLQKSILAYKCLLIHRSLNHRSESLLTGQVDVRKMNVGPLQENILRVSARTYFARSSILLSHWKYQELSGKSAEKKVAAILSLSLWGTFPDCTKTKKIETKSNVRPLQSVSIQIDELRPGIKMTGGPCRHVVGYEKRKKKRPEPRATIRSCASTWSKEANMRKLKREVDDKVTPTKRRSTQRSGTTVTDQEKA